MPSYFRVRNWDLFQHYRDRNPPWIKFYVTALEDPTIAMLPDDKKGQLFSLWLLAGRLDNRMPFDSAFIGRRINSSCPVDLDLFLGLGFIEMLAESYQDASVLLQTSVDHASAETEQRQRHRADSEVRTRRPRKVFEAPTLDEVTEFATEIGATLASPSEFLSYWADHDWTRYNGRKVKDWKLTFRDRERELRSRPHVSTSVHIGPRLSTYPPDTRRPTKWSQRNEKSGSDTPISGTLDGKDS